MAAFLDEDGVLVQGEAHLFRRVIDDGVAYAASEADEDVLTLFSSRQEKVAL